MFRQDTRALNGLHSAGWVRSLIAPGSVFVDPRWRSPRVRPRVLKSICIAGWVQSPTLLVPYLSSHGCRSLCLRRRRDHFALLLTSWREVSDPGERVVDGIRGFHADAAEGAVAIPV